MRVFSGITIVFLLLLAGCVSTKEPDNRPVIMVSIAPQKYFIERIADTLLRVEIMVPPGSSPETYEPTASQLKLLSKARAYFSLGLLDFEISMLKNIALQNPRLMVINHSKELNLLEGVCSGGHHHDHSHGHDPHVWSSPTEVKTMVKTTVNVLSKQYPEHTETFMSNAQVFLNDLDILDQHIKTELSNTKIHKFFIFHPALTYLARDYGIMQVSLEEDGKSPSMKHFRTVLQTAKDQGATTIFIQKEFDAKTAKTAAADIGGKVEIIDPLEENWLDNMYHITSLLKVALSGN